MARKRTMKYFAHVCIDSLIGFAPHNQKRWAVICRKTNQVLTRNVAAFIAVRRKRRVCNAITFVKSGLLELVAIHFKAVQRGSSCFKKAVS